MGTAAVPAGRPAQGRRGVPLRRGHHGRGAQRTCRPRDICTRKAFENAIAGVAATGGSTNAVLHLLAMAREAERPAHDRRFRDRSAARTPVFVDLKPGGTLHGRRRGQRRRHRRDRAAPGGRQATSMARAMTVTGRTFAEEAADAKETPGQEVIRPLEQADQAARRHRHSQRQPRARGLRDQAGRARQEGAPRSGARLRARGGRDGRP